MRHEPKQEDDSTEQADSSRLRAALAAGARAIAAFVTAGGLLALVQYFGWGPFTTSFPGWAFFLLLVVAIWLFVELVLAARIAAFQFWRRHASLADVLVAEAERFSHERNYEAILRHRKSFSRSLWLDGMPRHRIQLGRLAENAAVRLGDRQVQVAILIDDLGWTSVTLGEYADARQHLQHGLSIAQELSDYYWTAKGHRHLAGIAVEERNYTEASRQLEEATEAARHIEDRDDHTEMSAGIEYAEAVVALRKGHPEEAVEHLAASETLRKQRGDRSRLVKVHAIRGNIAEANRDLQAALDAYRSGLEAAEQLGRRDETIRNRRGLSRVLVAMGRHDEAAEHQRVAERMEKGTPIAFDLSEEIVTELLQRQ